MKDMFDCFEEEYNYRHHYYIIKVSGKNKKKKGYSYLSGVSIVYGKLVWSIKKETATRIIPRTTEYEIIKTIIKVGQIKCMIFRENELVIQKPVRKETWWDRIKVWFSRKFEEFMTTLQVCREKIKKE